MDVATRAWTREERALWRRIDTHAFENPTIALDFTRRLARNMAWSLERARAAVEEYRRFCFLGVVGAAGPVTPSEEVDEVWHLHLTYTRDYWDLWCGEALGCKLHHDPTAGGPVEQGKFAVQYAETLALYESYFGAPPAMFWPGTRQRFAARPRYRIIDGFRCWVLPRPSLRLFRLPALTALLTLIAAPRAAAAESWNPLDLPGEAFLLVFACFGALAILVTVLICDRIRTIGRPADLRNMSPVALGYINGGMKRAADTLFVALAQLGAADLGSDIIIEKGISGLPADLERFRCALPGRRSRKAMMTIFAESDPAAAMLDDLRRRNILLSEKRHQLLRLVTALPVGVLLVLGLAKIGVGLSRGRPVGFLVFGCIAISVGLVIAVVKQRDITQEAKDAFEAMRARLDRAVRAPRGEELALAFAFVGTTALTGTAYAAYAKVVTPPSGSGGSGCGAGAGGGCGGGGSGCGGGGCGGCGS